MKRLWIAAALGLVLTGAALAHSGVMNPAVKARMDLMGRIKAATGTLGDMAKGTAPFDIAKANDARTTLMQASKGIPAAFEEPETDPKSEALPAIWDNWAGFTGHADTLYDAATALDPGSLDGVRDGIRGIGKSCGACHADFRMKK